MRLSRRISVLAFSAMALSPTLAAAQHSSGEGTPMGDLLDLNRFATRGVWNQWAATRPAALSGLSKPSRDWIKAEVQRQAVSPRRPIQVAIDIDRVLGKDIRLLAKSERANPEDISGAVLLKIMSDTKSALVREARRAAKAPAPAGADQQWETRIAQADANLKESIELGSPVSLALARD